jgi:hypothetical protein
MRCVGPVMTEGKIPLDAARWPRNGLTKGTLAVVH